MAVGADEGLTAPLAGPGPGRAGSALRLCARAAWDDAAQAWEAVGQPYPLAAALLRAAEAALGSGDRDAKPAGCAGPTCSR